MWGGRPREGCHLWWDNWVGKGKIINRDTKGGGGGKKIIKKNKKKQSATRRKLEVRLKEAKKKHGEGGAW